MQTCARIMVRVHFHFESWVRGTRELPWSHLLPAARRGNVRPTILCSRPGYFHTGWVLCINARTSMQRGVGKIYWPGFKVKTLTMVSLKKGSLLQARTGGSRFMLRQLRLEMSLSQCGLAHTYPASETPYHCPGAPLLTPPLLFTDSAKRENDRGIYDTSPQGTLSPLNRINIKQQTSSIRSSIICCHLTESGSDRNWTLGTT